MTTKPTKTLEHAVAIYETVANDSDLKKRAQGIYEALDGLMGEENIAAIASKELEYLRSRRYSANSLGTKLSQSGYYEKIRQIQLIDGENAYQETKKDGSKTLKHFFFKYCGLNAKEWNERNSSNRVYNRLQQNIELNPTEQIETAYRLLESDNPWEVGAGLIALSGRRPHEIVARANFTKIEGEVYKVLFKGQGKKRGQEPEFTISLLIPVDIFLKAFKKFRANPEIKAVIKQANIEAPNDTSHQNRVVDKLSNKRLNRIVKEYFAKVLPSRSGVEEKLNDKDKEADINNTALKSAYLAMATKRDCEGSPARQMLFASKLAGHFIDIDPNDSERLKSIDRELQHLVTTLGYMGYHIKGEVPYFEPTKSIPLSKMPQTRLTQEDKAQLDEWSEMWGLSNQAVVMAKVFDLARKALKSESELIKQPEIETVDNTAVTELKEEFKAYQEKTDLKLNRLIQLLQSQQQTSAEPIASNQLIQTEQPKTEEKPQPKQPTRDWESVSKAELFGEGDKTPAKGTGATEERIKRAIQAIMDWNDQFPADSNKERKWSINNRAVRDLAGVNGQAVKEYLESHHQLVSDHNIKHGVTGDYHNRVHKASGKTTKDLVIEEVYPLIK
jgi:hypothetical protein